MVFLKAATAVQHAMEAAIAARIDTEMANLGLDRADPTAAVLIDDAIKDLDPRVQHEIEDAAYQDGTCRSLQSHKLVHLLDPGAGRYAG